MLVGFMFVRCIRWSRQIFSSRYLMNGLSNRDESYTEYSLPLLTTWLDSGG